MTVSLSTQSSTAIWARAWIRRSVKSRPVVEEVKFASCLGRDGDVFSQRWELEWAIFRVLLVKFLVVKLEV